MTKKNIIVGLTDNEFIRLELETEQDYNKENHLSICGTGIEDEFFNEETGEERARENLESCEDYLPKDKISEMWEAGKSKEDYIQEVLNVDGWREVLGDIEEIGDLYSKSCNGGQHQPKFKEYERFYIQKEDLKFIYEMWDKYHLKNITKIPKKKLQRLKEIFNKYESDFKNIVDLDSEYYAQQLAGQN